jgi:hypothetical protein
MMSWPRRCGSAITSIATIFPLVMVNVMTVRRRPRGVTRIAGRPLTNPLWASFARCENASACRVTGPAPRRRVAVPGAAAAASARTVTSGSSRSRSAAKSPLRDAAKKASTTFPLVNYLPVAPVHEPGCQLVNHVALVQLDSVDTEPMDACNALGAE